MVEIYVHLDTQSNSPLTTTQSNIEVHPISLYRFPVKIPGRYIKQLSVKFGLCGRLLHTAASKLTGIGRDGGSTIRRTKRSFYDPTIPTDGLMHLIIVHAYSKYPKVIFMKHTSRHMMNALLHLFYCIMAFQKHISILPSNTLSS